MQAMYVAGGGARFGVSAESFAGWLGEAARKCGRAEDDFDFLRGLRLEELVLARACAAGDERAWTEFLTRYREKLYDAARGITRVDASARELADGVYAELYGLREREGVRASKLESYMGRGPLEGWLRTVLAQEWVNRYRKQHRESSLDEQLEAGRQFAAPDEKPAGGIAGDGPETELAALARAVDAALRELEGEDRLMLAAHFLDGRTLAEVGRILGLHESSVSRRVKKLAEGLRKRVVRSLRAEGHSRRRAEELLESDVRDVTVDVRKGLSGMGAQEPGGGAFKTGGTFKTREGRGE